MRFLGVGDTVDLGDMYLRLQTAGHQVRVYAGDGDAHDIMRNMLEFTDDWRRELDWVREARSDGVVLIETASLGEVQDELRRDGFNVIGGSGLGDRLENDRAFGQATLRNLGMRTARSHEFTSFDDAIEFVRKEGGRYVFKLNGSEWSSTRSYIGAMENGDDMVAMLRATARSWPVEEAPSFVLMEHLSGVEVGVGAFFDGEKFLSPANLDWEHKRFFPGDIGELTGEMGTVVTYRGAEQIFERSLARMAPLLRESGYCGYINLNTIVNDSGIWPLEFTCRFGYPGFPILDSLHCCGWDEIFRSLISRDAKRFPTHDGYSVGVVMTVPPFPYRHGYEALGKGSPICFADELDDEARDALHYGEVDTRDGQLVTAGMIGYIMVVTGVAGSIEAAREITYGRVRKVVIPNARYRNDIGVRLIEHDMAEMRRLGLLS
ncbi:MAG TPA: phosphoribosylglycinamide synthetase C domain-containing protein [Gemmatimonadaceae bacterium]|nr:phosphoribosylglycinamide synthetase C domain-containing protein [Gemmatimonadaceae bacterium]